MGVLERIGVAFSNAFFFYISKAGQAGPRALMLDSPEKMLSVEHTGLTKKPSHTSRGYVKVWSTPANRPPH
jgi:hypothetical protein